MFGTAAMIADSIANSSSQQQQPNPNQSNHNAMINSGNTFLSNSNKYQQELMDFEQNEKASSIAKKSLRQKSQQQQQQLKFSGVYGTAQHSVYDKIKEQREFNSNNNEQIQVQIFPQDDWNCGNTTAMTADFSDLNDDCAADDGPSSQYYSHHGKRYDPESDPDNAEYNSNEGGEKWSKSHPSSSLKSCVETYFGYIFTSIVMLVSWLTPILFLTLPKMVNLSASDTSMYTQTGCGIECEGLLIGIAFKLFIVAVGDWAIFVRRPKNILPKVNELRALLVFLVIIIMFAFWLFYGVRVLDQNHTANKSSLPFDYFSVLQFSANYVDVLLFMFMLSVLVVELRHLRCEYVVTVSRSPDGATRTYSLGRMSIQRASVWILEQYYRDFHAFNPWLAQAHRKRAIQLAQLEQQHQMVMMANTTANTNGGSKRARKSANNVANMSATSSATNMNNMGMFQGYKYF
jgi:hypothetical protein